VLDVGLVDRPAHGRAQGRALTINQTTATVSARLRVNRADAVAAVLNQNKISNANRHYLGLSRHCEEQGVTSVKLLYRGESSKCSQLSGRHVQDLNLQPFG